LLALLVYLISALNVFILIVVAVIVGCDLFSRKAARGPAIPVDGEFAEGRLASNEQLLI